MGNKSDLEMVIDEKQAQLWAKDHQALYVRTSVRLDVNVGQAYRLVSEAIYNAPKLDKVRSASKLEKAKSFALHKNHLAQHKNTKSCC